MQNDIRSITTQTAVMSAKFDAHEKEDERRFEAIKDAFISSATNIDNVRKDLKQQTWMLALIIGGLLALSHIGDIFTLVHKASAAN